MNAPAVQTMTENLTLPFAQGASTLAITLHNDGDATQAKINPYDFSNYQARYGPLPNPSYILVAQKDIGVPTQVTINYVSRSSRRRQRRVNLIVPAGTLAGTSFAVWLQADGTSASNVLADPDIQLSTLHMSPAAPDGEAANWWSLVALIGNMAKLLWVIGYEKDVIRRHMELVQTQRYLPQAVKFSLDLLGRDLRVPRFPPRPYSFDENTIALYHLSDQFSSNQFSGNQFFGNQFFGTQVTTVHDSMTDYARQGHLGAGTSIEPATGRFDEAVAFRQPNSVISIPDYTHAFDLPANQSFTLECLVKPDAGTPDGEVLAKFASGNPNTKQPGWSLSVGTFNRGIALNVRLLLSDGTTPEVVLFADQQLPTTDFTHIAGVIDRQAKSAYLYIDGNARATQSIVGLRALTNTEAVRIGSGGAARSTYRGVIDEVRFSRTALTSFNPVLGEADEAYRQRLKLFAHWTLPTWSNLTNMLNESVGSIQGVADPNPIVLADTDAETVSGTLSLTVLPSGTAQTAYPAITPGPVSLLILQNGSTQPTDGFTLQVGETVQLVTQPVPGRRQSTAWLMINCGTGQANFVSPTNSPTVSLTTTKPGTLYIKVELTSDQEIIADTATLRILPSLASMAVGATIGDDGTLGITQDVADQPDTFFHPAYLITHNDTRATYGNDLNNRRMQTSVAQLLDKLLTSLATSGIAGQLQIVQAYTPRASGSSVANPLSQVGRALTLHHPTLTGDRLAVLAHSVGFTYVERQQGEQVLVLQRPDELIAIRGPQVVSKGASISLSLSPTATPVGVAASKNAIYTANSGTDTVSAIDPATGVVRTAVKVGWGPVALALSPDGTRLYSADSRSNTITAMDVDGATGNIQVVKTLPLQHNNPVALAHHGSIQRLYVVCQDDNSLLEVDTSTLSVLNGPVVVGASPTGIALTPNGQEVWVALNGDRKIARVGTASFQLIGSIALAQAPLKIAIAPSGKWAYATQPADNSVVILDVPGRKVSATTPLASSPGAITVAPDNSGIYVTSRQRERVYLLQLDGTVGGTVSVGQKSDDVVALSSTLIYVVSRQSSVVSTINAQKKVAVSAWPLGTGLGESTAWILELGTKRVSLSNVTTPQISLKGEHAGPVWLKGVYVLPGNTAPYTFDIRLKDESNAPIIRKEQYDLIMNILNVFHPIGVEVTTHAIRKYVIEVRGQLINIIPDYTFPNFRMSASLPH